MGRFEFQETPLPGSWIISRENIEDRRGFFARLFCTEDLKAIGFNETIAQINQTLTLKKGSVRGLHFQKSPYAETKIVTCLKGAIYDVAVDLREGSPTFLKWHGVILSAENRKSFLIPKGFAHGFQALQDNCELIYLHTVSYHPGSEGVLLFSDPKLGIQWPEAITEISDRDRSADKIGTDFKGI